MKNILIFLSLIFLVSFSSCSSKRSMSETQIIEKEIIKTEDVKKEISSSVETNKITETTVKDSGTVVIKETEFVIIHDSINNSYTSVKVSERTKTEQRNITVISGDKEEIKETKKEKLSSDSEVIETSRENIEREEKREFKNTAIVRGFYSLVILFLIAFIIIKKYFPSIFVKAKRFLTL